MNLSAPVVARAEADAGAYTVGQAAHDLGLLGIAAMDLSTTSTLWILPSS